ncbi:MAG: hypothetical protein IBJ15_14995 [Alphaproteobacteria bacterium]|nr:hypothetical protein [Alphaproteobacteria bacterium]
MFPEGDDPLLLWGLLIVLGLAVGQALRLRLMARAEAKAAAESETEEIRIVRRQPLRPAVAGPRTTGSVPFAANASGAAPDPEETVRRLARTLMNLAAKRDPRSAAMARRASARVTALAAAHGIGGPGVERAAMAAMLVKLGPAALPPSLQVDGPVGAFPGEIMDHARLDGPIPELVRAVRDGASVPPHLEKHVALIRAAIEN